MTRLINEQDEFLLSRLLDGDLPAEQADALRQRMEREPELRQVYAQLTGMDKLLAGRRSDRPTLSWDTFRHEIMDQVRRQGARGRVIRLANWLRVGVPLAAAASIVLAILVYQNRPAGEQPAGGGTAGVAVHEQKSASPKDDAPLVIFHRPKLMASARPVGRTETGASRESSTGEIRVTFEKSPELTEQYHQRDQMLRSSPSIQYHVESPTVAPPAVDELFAALGPLG